MMMRVGFVVVAALLLVSFTLGCVERTPPPVAPSPATSPATGLTELKIGWQPAFEHVAVPIILEKGWLENELGVPVSEMLFTGGGAKEFQAFRAGEIDVAVGGVAPAISTIANEYEKGHKVVAAVGMDIATLSIRATDGVPDFYWNYSDPAGSILKFEMEQGRPMKIGVWGGPGSIQWTIMTDWLLAHGIDPEHDVEIKTGGIVLMEWLRSKVIDAAVIGAELDDLMIQQGYGIPVLWISKEWAELKGYEHSPCCVVTVRGDLLREHPEVVSAVVSAFIRAQRFAYEHPDEAIGILDKHMPESVKLAFGGEDIWLPAVNASLSHYLGLNATYLGLRCEGQLVPDADPHLISGCALEFAGALRDAGAITRGLSEGDIFDYSFYDEAIKTV